MTAAAANGIAAVTQWRGRARDDARSTPRGTAARRGWRCGRASPVDRRAHQLRAVRSGRRRRRDREGECQTQPRRPGAGSSSPAQELFPESAAVLARELAGQPVDVAEAFDGHQEGLVVGQAGRPQLPISSRSDPRARRRLAVDGRRRARHIRATQRSVTPRSPSLTPPEAGSRSPGTGPHVVRGSCDGCHCRCCSASAARPRR